MVPVALSVSLSLTWPGRRQQGTRSRPAAVGDEVGRAVSRQVPLEPVVVGLRLAEPGDAVELGVGELPDRRVGVGGAVDRDNVAGSLMRTRHVDLVIVGADRIAANGDAANKIGTYPLAVLARHHGIPFYVAAPSSTVDLNTATGAGIPIEERSAEEVRRGFGKLTAPLDAKVFSPAFDVTPNELITAIITERGVHRAPFADALRSAVLDARVPA